MAPLEEAPEHHDVAEGTISSDGTLDVELLEPNAEILAFLTGSDVQYAMFDRFQLGEFGGGYDCSVYFTNRPGF